MKSTHCPSEGKARQKLTLMFKLVGTTWGLMSRNARQVTRKQLRLNLEYSSSA